MIYTYNNSAKQYSKANLVKKDKLFKFIRNILILTLIFILLSILYNVNLGKTPLTTRTITVESGMTIWDIAKEICKDNKKLNIQNIVIQIKKLNNIQNSMIYEGQELLVYNY